MANPARPFTLSELLIAMRHAATVGCVSYDWSGLGPLAGETVVTPDGTIGAAHHVMPGCPALPTDVIYGRQHRWFWPDHDQGPAVAYHISQLRPFGVAREIQ